MNLNLTPAGEGNWLGLRGLKHPRAFQGVSFIDSQTYPERHSLCSDNPTNLVEIR